MITIVYPLILHAVFDVSAQLSLDGDKLWLVFVDLYISEHVVHKTGESERGLGPDHSNASDERSVHRSFDEIEDMFNATPNFRLGSVVCLLLVCQRLVSIALLTDDRIHAGFRNDILPFYISCTKV